MKLNVSTEASFVCWLPISPERSVLPAWFSVVPGRSAPAHVCAASDTSPVERMIPDGKPTSEGALVNVPACPLAPVKVGVPDRVTPGPRSAVASAVALLLGVTTIPLAVALPVASGAAGRSRRGETIAAAGAEQQAWLTVDPPWVAHACTESAPAP